MARKKVDPVPPVPPGPKTVRLELTEEQQEALRLMAFEHKCSMAAMARAIVVQACSENARKGESKR